MPARRGTVVAFFVFVARAQNDVAASHLRLRTSASCRCAVVSGIFSSETQAACGNLCSAPAWHVTTYLFMLSSPPVLLWFSAHAFRHPPPPPPAYPGKPFNITVYHVNEQSYGAVPMDMNTADLHGDMFFDLRSTALPIECSAPNQGGHSAHDCLNPEVKPPADDPLVVTKLVLTIMAEYGPYGRYNVCFNHTTSMGDKNCTDGEYVCDCGGWGSKTQECGDTVGWENVSSMFSFMSHSCRTGSPNYECWQGATLKKTLTPGSGVWYSTPASGYGKTWKVASVVKRVSKACSDQAINEAVERAGYSSGCWTKCGPHATGATRNTSDPCWITCFEDTVLGPSKPSSNGSPPVCSSADDANSCEHACEQTQPLPVGR